TLKRMATARLGKDVLDVENVTYSASEAGPPLFDDVTLRLGPGERVGLVGVNGAGKSTLLRLLDGQVDPDEGRVKRGKTVKTAVLTQEVTELMEHEHMRVLEVMTEHKTTFDVGGKELSGSQLLETLGFSK